jgi:uncharacterized protein
MNLNNFKYIFYKKISFIYMPVVTNLQYQPPFWAKNGHINTLYTTLFRRMKRLDYQRESVDLPDGDFLYLDWSYLNASRSHDKLCICLHGLEGDVRRPYMAGMMARANAAQYDAVGMNFRGCTGEDNLKVYSYHTGKSEDLDAVIEYILKKYVNYKQIVLIGFSAGGNIVLKYLGEKSERLPKQIQKGVAFSVPCDLASCSIELQKPKNAIYMLNFLLTLKKKVRLKHKIFPNHFDLEKVLASRHFGDFDEAFTAPVNGFKDAADYWKSSGCISKLALIRVPTLLISAVDDHFLNEDSFPFEIAKTNPFFHFHLSRYGGHVGFWGENKDGWLWSEECAWQFILDKMR